MAYRDFLDFQTFGIPNETLWEHPSLGWINWSSHSTNLRTTVTFRDESQPTLPNGNGVYWKSTQYKAFYFFASSRSYSYEWDDVAKSRHHRTFGDSGSTSYPFPHDIFTWGSYNTWPFDPDIPNKIIGSLEGRALSACQSADMDVGQTLGELRESVGTLAEILIRLGNALAWYGLPNKAGKALALNALGWKSRDIPETLDAAAKGYVAYNYGIKPLMSDAYAIASIIRNGLISNMMPEVKFVQLDGSFGPPTAYANLEVDWKSSNFKRGAEICIRYGVKNQTLYDLNRYGVLDPLSLAWDLVPLSFVVDWFTGIGAFIDSLTQPFGLQFLDGYLTRFVKNQGSYSYRENYHSNVKGSLPTVTFNGHSSLRTRYWSWPIANPYLSIDAGLDKLPAVLALARVRGKL